jgi:hypothetical protein
LAYDEFSLEAIRRRYVGKWIALKETEILVVSNSHDEVLRELRKRSVDGAYVFYSPTEAEKQYGFLFLVLKWKLSSESS